MLDERFIESQKEILLKEKERILKELEQITLKTAEGRETTFPEYGSKEDENALEIAEYEERAELKETLEDLLSKIEKALQKIENGTYGVCENCGGFIERGRLEIFPQATLCATCSKNKNKE